MGIAAATIPNVCKMPGPPAPFVPVPLPNIGKSADSPKDYSTTVKFEGKAVAIKGATFGSMGDIASKGTGGGLISANTHGPTKFVGPGSMDVKVEGKNVQLLGDPMLNNCGPSGSPANAATMAGVVQAPQPVAPPPCTHPSLRREPPDDAAKKTPENQIKAMEGKVNKLKKQAAKLETKAANVAHSPLKAAAVAAELAGVNAGLKGAEFELQVAKDEYAKGKLKETSVKVLCASCGMEITELDVITEDEAGKPVVKECKAGGAFSESQAITQTAAIAQLVPGASLPLAAPAADLAEGSPTKGWSVKPAPQGH